MKRLFFSALIFAIVFTTLYTVFSGRSSVIADLILPRPETSQELVRELTQRYYGISPFWLERYGASVRSLEDAQIDADGDGLTLLGEYTYFTHPFVADTDGDGVMDGQEVREGNSPIGNGRLDVNANTLPDDWEVSYGLEEADRFAASDGDRDGLPNDREYLYGTDPTNPDTDGDGYDDGKEVRDGYDPSAQGEARSAYHIIIDKINIDAPIILSADASEEVLQKDLENGVIHYPGQALPGQQGNSYIAGHSSNYSWSPGNYNSIFQDLNDVAQGDEITIVESLANGREIRHRYIVDLTQEVAADDERIFEDSPTSLLTLTTCWPLGTAHRRIMVKASLLDKSDKVAYN